MVFKICPFKYLIPRFIIYGLQHLHPSTPVDKGCEEEREYTSLLPHKCLYNNDSVMGHKNKNDKRNLLNMQVASGWGCGCGHGKPHISPRIYFITIR